MSPYPSVLSAEEAYGPVTAIVVDPAYVADLVLDLVSVDRPDLADIVEPGEPHRLLVTAGGTVYPFGGL